MRRLAKRVVCGAALLVAALLSPLVALASGQAVGTNHRVSSDAGIFADVAFNTQANQYGEDGNDKLYGGSGNDTVAARNGRRERIDCGAGKKDSARVDKADRLKGCEKVKRARR